MLMYPNVPGTSPGILGAMPAVRSRARYCLATALKRLRGIWLLGNGSRMNPVPFGFGRVVAGSKMVSCLPVLSTQFEKSPLSISGVGTVWKDALLPARLTKPSYDPKKNVRFRPS